MTHLLVAEIEAMQSNGLLIRVSYHDDEWTVEIPDHVTPANTIDIEEDLLYALLLAVTRAHEARERGHP